MILFLISEKKLGDSCSKGQCNDTNAECSTTAQCTCKDTFYDKSSVCTQSTFECYIFFFILAKKYNRELSFKEKN